LNLGGDDVEFFTHFLTDSAKHLSAPTDLFGLRDVMDHFHPGKLGRQGLAFGTSAGVLRNHHRGECGFLCHQSFGFVEQVELTGSLFLYGTFFTLATEERLLKKSNPLLQERDPLTVSRLPFEQEIPKFFDSFGECVSAQHHGGTLPQNRPFVYEFIKKNGLNQGAVMQPLMGMNGGDVQPLEEEAQLPGSNLHDFLGTLRPGETMFLQTLLPKAKAVAVPVQDLEQGASAVAEYEQMPGEGIQIECAFDEHGKSVDSLTHVRAAKGKKDPGLSRHVHHKRLNTRSTTSRDEGANPGRTSIRQRPPKTMLIGGAEGNRQAVFCWETGSSTKETLGFCGDNLFFQ
jgi:hypothetical protein